MKSDPAPKYDLRRVEITIGGHRLEGFAPESGEVAFSPPPPAETVFHLVLMGGLRATVTLRTGSPSEVALSELRRTSGDALVEVNLPEIVHVETGLRRSYRGRAVFLPDWAVAPTAEIASLSTGAEVRPPEIPAPEFLAWGHAEAADEAYHRAIADAGTGWGQAEHAAYKPVEAARIAARRAWVAAGCPVTVRRS